jgi:ring-1,2-phenylacetyl-CoA epoxidase subunit PaaC
MNDSLISLLTALGDDELVIGHRHSEWTGHAPHIEEDVAFSSIAQDEIGHAAAYYSRIAELTGDDVDRLALGRERNEYRHAIVCERANRDWAYTLVRHWLYDVADDIRLESLKSSADGGLAALAVKLRREERYHLLHADTWMKRIARGPVEGRTRLVDAIADCWPDAAAIFEPIEAEEAAVAQGWLPTPSSELGDRFIARAAMGLDELGLPAEFAKVPEQDAEFVASSSGDLIERSGAPSANPARAEAAGGRHGMHSPDFEELWSVMTSTFRSDIGATW